MSGIDLLEHGGGHFHVRHLGDLIALPDPRQKHYQWVLIALNLGHVPGTPGDIPDWKRRRLFDRWRAAWDLPTFPEARRLAYVVDQYRSEVSNDLHIHARVDLGELWRARRWTLLLDLIDHLPAHSWYASGASMDEEHAKMMAEAIISRRESGEEKKETGPALTTWTPEVAALTNILDAVRGVQHAVVAVQAPKGKAPEAPKPAPRPTTPLERALKTAEYNRRKAAHEALVARVLPPKPPSQTPVH